LIKFSAASAIDIRVASSARKIILPNRELEQLIRQAKLRLQMH